MNDEPKYKIIFYKDRKGNEPVADYIRKLKEMSAKNKDARVNLEKISEYMNILKRKGLNAGHPYIGRITDKIWELRPLSNRIFFFGCCGDTFVLLSHFIKKSQKTPDSEKEKAERLMKRFLTENKL